MSVKMLKHTIKLLLLASLLISPMLWADPHASDWKGSQASVGFTSNTGNTTDSSLNSAALVKYTHKSIANALSATAAYSSNKDGVTKEKYYVENEFDYNFLDSHKQFLFLDTNATFDLFSAYTYAWVTSAGYGLSPILTKHWNMTIHLGPGLRALQDRQTKIKSDYAILNTGGSLAYIIDKDGKSTLSEAVVYNIGKPYNYLSTTTSLTMQIMQHLAAMISYQLQWTSKIPEGSNHTDLTDTLTSMNLVFSY
jgi:putative salt-induced outer membrane protein YdiY